MSNEKPNALTGRKVINGSFAGGKKSSLPIVKVTSANEQMAEKDETLFEDEDLKFRPINQPKHVNMNQKTILSGNPLHSKSSVFSVKDQQSRVGGAINLLSAADNSNVHMSLKMLKD